MSIIRVVKDTKYFVASNEPFNDKRLSWEARGVMGYLLSKPDNWEVMFNDLVNNGPAGEKLIRRILKELQEYGYLERKQSRLPNGKYEWVSTVYETPHIVVETMLPPGVDGATISPSRTSPSRTSPEGLHIISTESTNTESISTDKRVNLQAEMLGVLSEVTRLDYKIKRNAGRLAKPSKELLEAGYLPAQVKTYYSSGDWWYTNDWRGQRGQPPTPEQILETIAQAKNGNGRKQAPANEPAGFAGIREYLESQNGNE